MAEEKPKEQSFAEQRLEFARQMLEGAVNSGNAETVKMYLQELQQAIDPSSVPNDKLIQAQLLEGVFAQPAVQEHMNKIAQDETNKNAEMAKQVLQEQEEARTKQEAQSKDAKQQEKPAEGQKAEGKLPVEDVKVTNEFGRMSPPVNIPGEQAPAQGQQQGPKGNAR